MRVQRVCLTSFAVHLFRIATKCRSGPQIFVTSQAALILLFRLLINYYTNQINRLMNVFTEVSRLGGAGGHDPGRNPRAQVERNALFNSATARWLTAVLLFLSIFFLFICICRYDITKRPDSCRSQRQPNEAALLHHVPVALRRRDYY